MQKYSAKLAAKFRISVILESTSKKVNVFRTYSIKLIYPIRITLLCCENVCANVGIDRKKYDVTCPLDVSVQSNRCANMHEDLCAFPRTKTSHRLC